MLIRAFFACCLFITRTVVFFKVLFETPTGWHVSISIDDTPTLISFKIFTTLSSKFWSEALSTMTHRISDTNSSVCVKQHTAGKV